jgi:hypothetical protein
VKGSETGRPDTSDQRPRGPKGPVTPSPASRTCLQLRTALVTFRQPLSLRFVQVLDVLLGSFSPLQYLLREMRRVHFIPGSTRDHPPGTSLRTSERRWPCRRIPVPLRHQVTVSHAVCCPERGTGERSFFFFSGRPTRRVVELDRVTVSPCHRVTVSPCHADVGHSERSAAGQVCIGDGEHTGTPRAVSHAPRRAHSRPSTSGTTPTRRVSALPRRVVSSKKARRSSLAAGSNLPWTKRWNTCDNSHMWTLPGWRALSVMSASART